MKIIAKNLVKNYRKRNVVRGVSFEISQGSTNGSSLEPMSRTAPSSSGNAVTGGLVGNSP